MHQQESSQHVQGHGDEEEEEEVKEEVGKQILHEIHDCDFKMEAFACYSNVQHII